MLHRLALILLAVAPLAAAPTAHADELKGAGGDVTATVSWTPRGDFEYRDLRVLVVRAGVTVWDQPLAVRGCTRPYCKPGDVQVADLDADGEPEVLVDVFTGGAHCCDVAQLFTWNGTTYTTTQRNFADTGYGIEDLDGDGRPELASADARFAYAFSSFAASGFPLQVFQVDHGTFVDVTAGFPALLRADAAGHYREWRRRKGRRSAEPLGVLAAWVADMERLGEGAKARKELQTALRRGWLKTIKGWPSGRRYVRELDVFLKRLGYRAATP